MKFRVETVVEAVGVVAAVLATAISTLHILAHLRHNKTPLWWCTVRILAVVPVFALSGSSSLLFGDNRRHWSSPLSYASELYESVAMVSFMQFILALLGGPAHLACRLRSEATAPVRHPWPVRLVVRPYEAGADFVSRASRGILQYALVSALLFVTNCLLWRPPWDTGAPLFPRTHTCVEATVKVAKSLSCGWAMYNLVLFYRAVLPLLGSCRPLMKFMSIKGVIFFSFWQGSVLFVLGRAGAIPNTIVEPDGEIWHSHDISSQLNFLLVCLEMPLFAVMHARAYPLPRADEAGQCSGPELGTAGPGPAAGHYHTLRQFFREVQALRGVARLQAAAQDSPLQPMQSGSMVDSAPGSSIATHKSARELSSYVPRPSPPEVPADTGPPSDGNSRRSGAR